MSTMVNYEQTKANFTLETPEYYNFGFDVIDKRASEADKLAFIAVDATYLAYQINLLMAYSV